MKSSKNRKISIRKHLPLSVRVHYDMVRNFSPMKLFGIGVMALVAVFGVLLVSQAINPTSSADTIIQHGKYSSITGFSYSSTRAYFNIVPKDNLTIVEMKYYAYSVKDYNCPESHLDRYENLTTNDSATARNTGFTYGTPADVNENKKVLCVMTAVRRPNARGNQGGSASFLRDFFRYEINRETSSSSSQRQTDSSSSQSANPAVVNPRIIIRQVSDELGLRLEATANVDVFRSTWQNTAIKLTQRCDAALWGSLDSSDISSGQIFTVPTEGRPTQHVACFRVQRNTGFATYIYGQLPVAGSTPTALENEEIAETSTFAHRPVIRVTKNGNTYSAVNTNTNASIYKWKYVIRTNSTCDSSVFTNGGSDSANLIRPQYNSRIFTPANNDEVNKYNGKYICFDALSTTGLWAKEKAGARLSLVAVDEPEEDPDVTTAQQAEATSKPGPELEVTKDGNTYTVSNTNTEVTIHRYKYVIRTNSTCDSSVFTNGGSDSGNLIKPQYTDTFTPANNEEVDKYNGKYICFDAVATNDVWAKKKVSVKLSLTAVEEVAEEPEETEPEETTQLADTGIFDDGESAGQLLGYVLIAAAVLGTARILVVKKYKKIG